MARTIDRGGGGARYGGKGKGKGSANALCLRTPCAVAANDALRDRFKSYWEYVSRSQTSQEGGTYYKACRGVHAHGSAVGESKEEAKAVKGVGDKIAGKAVAFLRWARYAREGCAVVSLGRFEKRAEEQRWWRVECLERPCGRVMARRSWGLLGEPGLRRVLRGLHAPRRPREEDLDRGEAARGLRGRRRRRRRRRGRRRRGRGPPRLVLTTPLTLRA